MYEFLLQLNYLGNVVDVVIDDSDTSLLIDVLNDMCDEFEKNGFELPTNPVLQYDFRGVIVELTDDASLMKMFEVSKTKNIKLNVGSLPEPNFIWSLAQKVKSNNNPKKLDKLPIRRPKKDKEPMISPRRSTRNRDVIILNKDKASHFESNFVVNSPLKSKAKSPSSITQPPKPSCNPNSSPKTTCEPNKEAEPDPNANSTTEPNPAKHAFPHGKKMCRSTAMKKGFWVPKVRSVQQQNETTHGHSLRRRVGNTLEDNEDIPETSSDNEDYEPEVSDDESEDIVVDDFDEGDIVDLLNHNYVDGEWDPLTRNDPSYEDSGYVGYLGQIYKNGEVYADADIGRINLKKWQLFVDREHFRDTLRDFCIQEGFAVMVERVDNSRFTGVCADQRCDWSVHASMLPDGYTWAIKNIGKKHLCDMNLVKNPMCSAEWVGKKLLEDVKANPDISAKALLALLWERYGLEMPQSSMYRAKREAMKLIQGGHDESYTHLPQYCELLKEHNPGSVAFCTWRTLLQPTKALQFTSIFVSFDAQFRGLISGCRGVVGVDGTHLKGNYGGVLLSAVSLDGNNEIFPVAVAVVDSENKQSWKWFFDQLKNILTRAGRHDWCIMSDRQKGIDPSLDEVWPTVDRRYCARHLCSNFKGDHPGLLMHKLFWGVTNAYSAFTFRKALQQVQQFGGLGAVKWFKDIGPLERWTRWKFDPTLCNDENTNNFVESFNSTIGVERTYPILTLLEGVRRTAMVRHATRQQIAQQWPDEGICPSIVHMIKVLTKDSRYCQAYPSGRGMYEVHDGRSRLPVSIHARTCACGKWQISGIPCKHGIKAILSEGRDPTHFVSEWFKVDRYKQCYNENIAPVPDQEQWPINAELPTLIPPTMKRSVGRPSRNRKREEHELRKGKRSTTVSCSKCKGFGHNAKKCKGGNTAKELAEQQGKFKAPTATKGYKRQKNVYGQYDGSLIDAMIAGNANEWVDPFETTAAGDTTSTAAPSVNEVGETSKQGKKRGRKSKSKQPTTLDEFDDLNGFDDSIIESMISHSPPTIQSQQATATRGHQPQQHRSATPAEAGHDQHTQQSTTAAPTAAAHQTPQSPTAATASQPMSPLSAKIKKRLSMLD